MSLEAGPRELLDLKTLVFTDLVDSTSLKERLGNVEALRLIREHHEIVRSLLREFPTAAEVSTAGDSFFLSFEQPSDAVTFALRLQARLSSSNRSRPIPLSDRIGIHCGEVTIEYHPDGRLKDIQGLEVDKAARVMSLGQANQILLTAFAFDNAQAFLRGRSIPEVGEIRWVRHGAYELKGVEGGVEICEVSSARGGSIAAPTDTQKARRLASGGDAQTSRVVLPGWRRYLVDDPGCQRRAKIGGALAALLGLLTYLLPPVRDASYDWSYLLRPDLGMTNAVIVRMDHESYDRLGQREEGIFDRRYHAQLIDLMRESGARAVVFDLLFRGGGTNEASDRLLIEASRAYGRVAVAGIIRDAEDTEFVDRRAEGPFPELEEVTHWGLSHFKNSPGTILRDPYPRHGDVESLASAVAHMLGVPVSTADTHRRLNYYGRPGTPYPWMRYADVLANPGSSNRFKDKLVFVGADYSDVVTKAGRDVDLYATPYSRWGGKSAPGVEIVATSTLNLLRADSLRCLSPWVETGLVACFGLLFGYGLGRLRPVSALAVASGAGTLVALVASCQVWVTQVWFPWVAVCGVQIPGALAWSVISWANGLGRNRYLRHPLSTSPPPPSPSPSVPLPPAEGEAGAPPAVPGYTMLREIGRGAYGRVWLARDAIGQMRAVKVVRRSAFESDRPYEREFSGIRRFTPLSLEHPGLVRVFHVGSEERGGFFYYVMEAADDEQSGASLVVDSYRPLTLARLLQRRGPLPAGTVIELGLSLANALEFLHHHDLIHRDLKPANIIYVRGQPKLADVGLVTGMESEGEKVSLLGTAGYMAPEGPGSAAGDIYGLGKVLYVAATGFSAADFPELPRDLDQRADRETLLTLNRVWLSACEPEVGRRCQTASALSAQLRAIPVAGVPPGREEQ